MPETDDVDAALERLRQLIDYDAPPNFDACAIIDAHIALQAQEIKRLTPQALPYTTPTGHTYELPTDWPSLHNYMVTWAQGWAEHWDDAEIPPHPENQPDIARLTWNLLAAGQHEIERLRVELQSLRTLHAMVHSGDDCDEIERLRGLLREHEWCNNGWCWHCRAYNAAGHGHAPGCPMAAALTGEEAKP